MSFIVIPHVGDTGWMFSHLESNVANGDDKDWFGYLIGLGAIENHIKVET
jgi:hypothetical protein